jgi:two-component system, cell cycle sensor histidine kinase and response regulator CckA
MSEQPTNAPAGRIMIVDDTPANLQFLRATLAAHGYAVHPAHDGELALQFVQRTLPDLILLDIVMPGLDGYQVCEQLKGSERTRDIPVIFMTALSDTEEKVSGLRLGAVDYITKPFQVDELLARVQTHIALHTLQRQLAAQNAQLRQEIAERQRAEAKLAASEARQRLVLNQIPALVWIIDHDLRFTSTDGAGLAGINSRPNQSVGMSLYEYCRTDDPEFPPIAAARRALAGESVSYDIDWSGRAFQSHVEPFLDPQGQVCGVIGIALDITERKAAEHEREQLIGQLQEALASIKTLRGLVPICAACKKIRDDGGYWNQLESYLHSHTEAEFSHGICPECTRQLYGDLYGEAAGA